MKYVLGIILLFSTLISAQNPKKKILTQLIYNDSIISAKTLIDTEIENFKSQKQYDSITNYVFDFGKIDLKLANNLHQTLSLVNSIKANASKTSLANAYIALSKLYNENSELTASLEYANKAKVIGIEFNNDKIITNASYYLSEANLRLGNFNGFREQILTAKKHLEKNQETFTIAPKVYNYLGALSFFTSKPDSAYFYYNKGLKVIDHLEQNLVNTTYQPATIKSNIVLLKLNQGEQEEARVLVEECITHYKTFLRLVKNHPLKHRVYRNLILSYLNLSSLFFELGDYKKAETVTNYAYKIAKQHLKTNSQEYYACIEALADIKQAQYEYKNALQLLNQLEETLKTMSGDRFFNRANINADRGQISYDLQNFKQAESYLTQADSFFEKSFNGEYTKERVINTINLAKTLIKQHKSEQAQERLIKLYDYLKNSKTETYELTKMVMFALAETNLKSKNYDESIKWSDKLITQYQNNTTDKGFYYKKYLPSVLLYKAKGIYNQSNAKDSNELSVLKTYLDDAIDNIKQRKNFTASAEDISFLLDSNDDVFSFAKKLNIDLYQHTNDKAYLFNVLQHHESNIYNKIRTRLNIRKSINYNEVPKTVIDEERNLLSRLTSQDNIDSLFSTEKKWTAFLQNLENSYPKYYKMKYASLVGDLKNIKIPEYTTIIRYLYVENDLYAIITSQENQSLKKISTDKNQIEALLDEGDSHNNLKTLHTLYKSLWQPLAHIISTENIIIIPDGNLFNISFESLISEPSNSYKDILEHSLLSKYNITYNFSYVLADKTQSPTYFESNYIAFVPEFSDAMKENYQIAIADSLTEDQSYLKLLPQPFSLDLAKEFTQLFKGDAFLNENATKQIFKQQAKEHKIIHIGTHAESNNVSPELSRLIFAKNINDTIAKDDNSLYTYEIYNENLASNLAILTACETGKPTYQSGEGMISLAHAFNYAGSESILTSLWKIDEQSSAKIIENFYGYLKEGLTKDKALRQAKLDYLSTSKGRTSAPQYWAGLVLIGDTTPIDLKTSSENTIYWILGVFVLAALIYYLIRQPNNKSH